MAVFILEHKSEMPVIKEIPQLVTHSRSQAVHLSTIAFIHVHTENSLLATLQGLDGCFTDIHTLPVTSSYSVSITSVFSSSSAAPDWWTPHLQQKFFEKSLVFTFTTTNLTSISVSPILCLDVLSRYSVLLTSSPSLVAASFTSTVRLSWW